MEDQFERTNLTLLPYHHPLLRAQAETVEFPLCSEDLKLINDMLYSVEDSQLKAAEAPWPSAAGMAAPQWGVSKQIFVIRRKFLKNNRSRFTLSSQCFLKETLPPYLFKKFCIGNIVPSKQCTEE